MYIVNQAMSVHASQVQLGTASLIVTAHSCIAHNCVAQCALLPLADVALAVAAVAGVCRSKLFALELMTLARREENARKSSSTDSLSSSVTVLLG